MKFLQEYAAQNDCSLYDALRRSQDNDIWKGTQAARFLALVESFAQTDAEQPVSELLAAVLAQSGYEAMLRTEGSQERLDNLAELKQSVHEYEISCGEESTLEHYLAHVALFTNSDAGDTGDRVKLMTVHSAKGLEFSHVFLCAMNEGVFPSKKTDSLLAMEEERRLAFVAMTRAQQALYLSESEGRNFDGSPRFPSRFLLDIDPALLYYARKPRDSLIEQARDDIALRERWLLRDDSAPAFSPGQRVLHRVFGAGTIEQADTARSAYTIRFDGMPTARTISFRVELQRLDGQTKE